MAHEPLQSARLVCRGHAIERMLDRNVTVDDVRFVVIDGETLENYLDDKPFPSRLIWDGALFDLCTSSLPRTTSRRR
jgi:hypothetical protein